MYVLSKYNHLFKHNKNYYVYNFLTTSIVQLDSDTFDNLKKGEFNNLSEETFNGLKSEGLIVDKDCDETDMFRYYFERSKYSSSADSLSIVFIPTYNCNLRCPYCYEGLDKNSKMMSAEEVDSIIAFAEDRIIESNNATPIRTIDIQLYGGEPMLCKDLIIYFCKSIKSLACNYNLQTSYSMVSNMTLLDEEYIEFLKEYDVNIQVSIDGNKSLHDCRRIYKNGEGTYDLILRNLARLCDAGLKKNIIIRLNVDCESLDEACNELVKLQEFSNDIYFGVLTSYKGCNDEYDKCMESINADIVLSNKTSLIYKSLGLPVPQRFGKKGPCSLNCENKFMIDCYLDVYKCDLLINHKECRVGYIKKDGEFVIESNFYKQMSFSPFKSEKCIKCKFLPQCAGGCPAVAYLNAEKKDADLDIFECGFNDEKINAALENYIECL